MESLQIIKPLTSKAIFNNHNVVTHGEAEYMFSRNTELIDDKIANRPLIKNGQIHLFLYKL